MRVDIGDDVRLVLLKFLHTGEIHGIAEDQTYDPTQYGGDQQKNAIGYPEEVMTTLFLSPWFLASHCS
jgi:hypothetical protein